MQKIITNKLSILLVILALAFGLVSVAYASNSADAPGANGGDVSAAQSDEEDYGNGLDDECTGSCSQDHDRLQSNIDDDDEEGSEDEDEDVDEDEEEEDDDSLGYGKSDECPGSCSHDRDRLNDDVDRFASYGKTDDHDELRRQLREILQYMVQLLQQQMEMIQNQNSQV